jgi:carboxymethylenebutenolidase
MPDTQPDGHLATPPSAASAGPPVLVLHAWWGLNDTIRAFCARLAEAGFVAFAPDLYHGKVADTIAEAEALSSGLDADRAKADVAAAARFVADRFDPAGSGLAVVGFSLGAYFALDLSAADPERVRSVVVYYGTGPADFGRSRAEYLGHFAEADPYEPQAFVDDLEAALRQADRPLSFHIYPGTGHWFAEPDRPDAFAPAAARLAWDRTLAFLGRSAIAG